MSKPDTIMPPDREWYAVPQFGEAILTGEPAAVDTVWRDYLRQRNRYSNVVRTTYAKIADRTGLSRRHVITASARLEAVGLIRRDPVPGRVGKGKQPPSTVIPAMERPWEFPARFVAGGPVTVLGPRPRNGERASAPAGTPRRRNGERQRTLPGEMVIPSSPLLVEMVIPSSPITAEMVNASSPPSLLEEELDINHQIGDPAEEVAGAAATDDDEAPPADQKNDDDDTVSSAAVVAAVAEELEATDDRPWWPDGDEPRQLAAALLTAQNASAFVAYARRRFGGPGATNPAGIVRDRLRRWTREGLPAELRVQHLRPVPATEPKPEPKPKPPARTPRPWCGKCWGPDPSARREVTRSNGVKHATGKPCPNCSPAAVGWADEDLTDATTKPATPVGSPERPVQARTGTDGYQPLARPLDGVLAAPVPGE